MKKIIVEYDDHIEDVLDKVEELFNSIGYSLDYKFEDDEPSIELSVSKLNLWKYESKGGSILK